MTEVTGAEIPLADLGWRWSVVERQRLGDRVWRVHLDEASPRRTVIAKRLTSDVSATVELLARRWLPAVGLASVGPSLLRVIPAADGMVWHLYEDLGGIPHGSPRDDDERLRALVVAIARVHTSFASHQLLREIRGRARDLSASAHGSTLRYVLRAIRGVRAYAPDRAALLERLGARFTEFLDEAPDRVEMLRELGGPHTLVHGDLWPKNAVVVSSPAGPRARFVDWDRTGLGSIVYDLSTLLSRVPLEVRERVLGWYRQRAGPIARALSSHDELNQLSVTCERTRLGEWTRWRVVALDSPDAGWAWGELARVEPWLDVPLLFPAVVGAS